MGIKGVKRQASKTRNVSSKKKKESCLGPDPRRKKVKTDGDRAYLEKRDQPDPEAMAADLHKLADKLDKVPVHKFKKPAPVSDYKHSVKPNGVIKDTTRDRPKNAPLHSTKTNADPVVNKREIKKKTDDAKREEARLEEEKLRKEKAKRRLKLKAKLTRQEIEAQLDEVQRKHPNLALPVEFISPALSQKERTKYDKGTHPLHFYFQKVEQINTRIDRTYDPNQKRNVLLEHDPGIMENDISEDDDKMDSGDDASTRHARKHKRYKKKRKYKFDSDAESSDDKNSDDSKHSGSDSGDDIIITPEPVKKPAPVRLKRRRKKGTQVVEIDENESEDATERGTVGAVDSAKKWFRLKQDKAMIEPTLRLSGVMEQKVTVGGKERTETVPAIVYCRNFRPRFYAAMPEKVYLDLGLTGKPDWLPGIKTQRIQVDSPINEDGTPCSGLQEARMTGIRDALTRKKVRDFLRLYWEACERAVTPGMYKKYAKSGINKPPFVLNVSMVWRASADEFQNNKLYPFIEIVTCLPAVIPLLRDEVSKGITLTPKVGESRTIGMACFDCDILYIKRFLTDLNLAGQTWCTLPPETYSLRPVKERRTIGLRNDPMDLDIKIPAVAEFDTSFDTIQVHSQRHVQERPKRILPFNAATLMEECKKLTLPEDVKTLSVDPATVTVVTTTTSLATSLSSLSSSSLSHSSAFPFVPSSLSLLSSASLSCTNSASVSCSLSSDSSGSSCSSFLDDKILSTALSTHPIPVTNSTTIQRVLSTSCSTSSTCSSQLTADVSVPCSTQECKPAEPLVSPSCSSFSNALCTLATTTTTAPKWDISDISKVCVEERKKVEQKQEKKPQEPNEQRTGNKNQTTPPPDWGRDPDCRLFAFDIECVGTKGFPDALHDEIVAVSWVFGSLKEKQKKDPKPEDSKAIVVCTKKSARLVNLPNAHIIHAHDEKQLMIFYALLNLYYLPTWILSYNGNRFDLPYCLDRAQKLGVAVAQYYSHFAEPLTIKETARETTGTGALIHIEIGISGVNVIDIYQVVKKMEADKLTSYTLNAVAQHYINWRKADVHHTDIPKLYRGTLEQVRRLLYYNIIDSWLVMRIFYSRKYALNIPVMARISGIQSQHLFDWGPSAQSEASLLLECKPDALLKPLRVRKTDKTKYAGATVIVPITGMIFNPVMTEDFASLYPSIIIALNLCTSTHLTWERIQQLGLTPDQYIAVPSGRGGTMTYWCRRSLRQGVIPFQLESYLAARKVAKKKMGEATDADTKDIFDAIQKGVKIKANSVYGLCKQMMEDLAATVTFFGRKLIDACKNLVEKFYVPENGYGPKQGYPQLPIVKYGDTDSIMCDFGPMTLERAFEIGKDVAEKCNRMFKNMPPIKLEFEKVYYPYLLQRKKRYAGVFWTPETFEETGSYDKNDKKGSEAVRSDSCKEQKDAMLDCYDLLLLGHLKKDSSGLKMLRDMWTEERQLRKFGLSKRVKQEKQRKQKQDEDEKWQEEMAHMDKHTPDILFSRCTQAKKQVSCTVSAVLPQRHADIIDFDSEIFVDPYTYWSDPKSPDYTAPLPVPVTDFKKWTKEEKADFTKTKLPARKAMVRPLTMEIARTRVSIATQMLRYRAQRLLERKVDFSKLVLSKSLRKKNYPGKVVQVEVAEKMKRRDPGSAPVTGDRVHFVYRTMPKKTKMADCADEPLFVLKNRLPVDVDMYVQKQLIKPMSGLFIPVYKTLMPHKQELQCNMYYDSDAEQDDDNEEDEEALMEEAEHGIEEEKDETVEEEDLKWINDKMKQRLTLVPSSPLSSSPLSISSSPVSCLSSPSSTPDSSRSSSPSRNSHSSVSDFSRSSFPCSNSHSSASDSSRSSSPTRDSICSMPSTSRSSSPTRNSTFTSLSTAPLSRSSSITDDQKTFHSSRPMENKTTFKTPMSATKRKNKLLSYNPKKAAASKGSINYLWSKEMQAKRAQKKTGKKEVKQEEEEKKTKRRKHKQQEVYQIKPFDLSALKTKTSKMNPTKDEMKMIQKVLRERTKVALAIVGKEIFGSLARGKIVAPSIFSSDLFKMMARAEQKKQEETEDSDTTDDEDESKNKAAPSFMDFMPDNKSKSKTALKLYTCIVCKTPITTKNSFYNELGPLLHDQLQITGLTELVLSYIATIKDVICSGCSCNCENRILWAEKEEQDMEDEEEEQVIIHKKGHIQCDCQRQRYLGLQKEIVSDLTTQHQVMWANCGTCAGDKDAADRCSNTDCVFFYERQTLTVNLQEQRSILELF